ncbi:MAG TPA: SEC-C metal-binding domain-containing protein [Rectinema sp.]|nr:SEC-C metal-binding domain-containing protein [Rectinema sp.]
MKVTRNALCPCGSGKKYKKCCLLKNTRPSPHEFIEATRKAFSKKYCLHPDKSKGLCKGDIIKAHTISKFMLKKTTPNAQVYTPPQFGDLLSQLQKRDGITLIKRGISQISTFTGFCAHHDKELFSPIEDVDFEIDEESIFLLTYRSVCHELFNKVAQSNSAEYNLLHGTKDVDQQVKPRMQQLLEYHRDASKAGASDLDVTKSKLDIMLVNKDYQKLRYKVFEINKSPEIVASFCSIPYCDYHGNNIIGERFLDVRTALPMVVTQVLPYRTYGVIIFSWIQSDELVDKFIRSLSELDLQSVPSAVVRYVFSHSETFAVNPNWWESQKPDTISYLLRLYKNYLPGHELDNSCLVGDREIVDWSVTNLV